MIFKLAFRFHPKRAPSCLTARLLLLSDCHSSQLSYNRGSRLFSKNLHRKFNSESFTGKNTSYKGINWTTNRRACTLNSSLMGHFLLRGERLISEEGEKIQEEGNRATVTWPSPVSDVICLSSKRFVAIAHVQWNLFPGKCRPYYEFNSHQFKLV